MGCRQELQKVFTIVTLVLSLPLIHEVLSGFEIAHIVDNAYPLPNEIRAKITPGFQNFGVDHNPQRIYPTPENPGWQGVRKSLDTGLGVLGSQIDNLTCAADTQNHGSGNEVNPECRPATRTPTRRRP